MTPRKLSKFISILFLIAFSLIAIIHSNNSSSYSSPLSFTLSPTPVERFNQQNVEGASTANIGSQTESDPEVSDVSDSPVLSEGQQTYQVVKVVDGDTIDIDIEGDTTRLRIIGIDTPETVDPRKPVQCFGIAASHKAKEILTGQYVTITADPTQNNKDKYGRLLRYVYLPDGTDYGLFMISNGYAHEYTYQVPYEHQSQYKQAEADARDSYRGLWSPSTCDGNK